MNDAKPMINVNQTKILEISCMPDGTIETLIQAETPFGNLEFTLKGSLVTNASKS